MINIDISNIYILYDLWLGGPIIFLRTYTFVYEFKITTSFLLSF